MMAKRSLSRCVKLDLGCGKNKVPGAIGVDVAPVEGVDVVADFNWGLPFADSSVDEVHCSHVLEHVPHFLAFMEEIWRVLRPGGRAYIRFPHASSSFHTWKDPTHYRPLLVATFHYFDTATEDGYLYGYYSRARFRIVRSRLRFVLASARRSGKLSPLRRLLATTLEALANRSPRAQYLCERYWGPLVGIEEAEVVLEAVKPEAAA
jgi:SAM-dependent methyltransferase